MTGLDRIRAEILIQSAREKHGLSFELATADRKLRILVEEVGEIARAIQDVESAIRACDEASRHGTTAELEAARDGVRAASKHVLDEVAQVGACALRWLDCEVAL